MLMNLNQSVIKVRSCDATQNTHLGIMSAQSVILDVLFLNISLVMEER